MSTIYYCYHHFTDSLWNDISPWHQSKNYPELFSQVAASWVKMVEWFIPNQYFVDWGRVGYLNVPEEILNSTWFTISYIEDILIRLGSVFSLYIISDISVWLSNHTTLSKSEIDEYILSSC